MKILRVKQDFPTIQSAVDAARPGDIILVEGSIYNEQVVITKSNIKIIGSKEAVLDGQFRLAFGFVLNSVRNIALCGFAVRNYNLDGVTCLYGANNHIMHNIITDNSGFGISTYNSHWNGISENTVSGSGGYGMYLVGSTGSSVERNRVFSNGTYGLYIHYSGAGNDVLYNNIYDNNGGGIASDGANTLVKSNAVYGNLYDGIYVNGNSLVECNEVKQNKHSGINTVGASNTIRANKVECNAQNGISIAGYSGNGHTVTGNKVIGNGLGGISIGSRLNVVGQNTALGNGGYDIVRMKPDNYLFDNVCCNSNPPGLCTEPEGCWEMEA